MKKIIAVIIAALLAFTLAIGDYFFQIDFSDYIPKKVTQLFSKNKKRRRPKIPKPLPTEPIEDNTLSYDERLNKGAYYYDKGFLNYAINEYSKASNMNPSNPFPYQRLMEINFELFNYDKSRLNAEQILKLKSDDFTAKYFLVLNSIRQSQFEEAQNRLNDLSAAGITDPRLLYLTSLIRISTNNHKEGQAYLKKVVDPQSGADPILIDKSNIILSAYEEFNFAEEAEDLYLSVLLVKSLNEVEEYELAIYKLKEILKTRSDLRDAWILLGFSYLNLEKYVFAVTAFERAYELDPEWAATQYFLGTAYAELSKNEDAIIYLNYALSNGFKPAVVIEQKLADLYFEAENYKKSVNAYESVLSVNKKDIRAYIKPIWIYIDFLNEPQKALALANEAMQSFPESAMAYNLLGWAQFGGGDFSVGENSLRKSLSIDPDLPEAHYNLGQLYEKKGDYDSALDIYEKVYQLDLNGSIGNLAAKKYNALLIKIEKES